MIVSTTNKQTEEGQYAKRLERKIPVEVESSHPTNTRTTQYRSAKEDRGHLYVVITTDDQFYVGVTGREPEERWKEHLGVGEYSGAQFLQGKQIAGFVLVGENLMNAEEIEDKLTLQLMAKHGIENCNGGEYAAGENPSTDVKRLLGNPSEYDFLDDVDVLESEAIPASEAHPSVKNTFFDNIVAVVVYPVYLLIYLLYALIYVAKMAVGVLLFLVIIGVLLSLLLGIIGLL